MNDAIFCTRAEFPMRTPLAIRETEILEKALAALPRTAGLHGRIAEDEPHSAACGDALIEIKTANRAYPFVAEVKNVPHFGTISLVKDQGNRRETSQQGRSHHEVTKHTATDETDHQDEASFNEIEAVHRFGNHRNILALAH
jgi:hypothetical protein